MSSTSQNTGWNHLYKVDQEALNAVREAKPWYDGEGATNPKYFQTTYVSAAATVKMLEHALRGVEKGMASANRMPIEVGMLPPHLTYFYNIPCIFSSLSTSLLCCYFHQLTYIYIYLYFFGLHIVFILYLLPPPTLTLPYYIYYYNCIFLYHQVMGILIGRPSTDPNNLRALIVTDAFPLPVEGFETSVEAGGDALIAMVNAQEVLEQTRDERIIGWYHSHPFDVEKNPMYFFSSTDCQNQVVWQREFDRTSGFVGIVIDPKRSIAKGRPEMGSFRAFLPSYSQTVPMAPDGVLVTKDNKNEVEVRWGPTWNRYYIMETQYFMADLTKKMVDMLSKNFTWISVLSVSLKNDVEYRQELAQRIGKIATSIKTPGTIGGGDSIGGGGGISSRSSSSSDTTTGDTPKNKLDGANFKVQEFSVEQRLSGFTQEVKEGVFTKP